MKLLSYGLDRRMEPRLAFSLRGYAIDVMRASLWMKEDRLDEDSNELITFLKDSIMSFAHIEGVHFFLLPQDVLDPVAERIIMNAAQGIFYFSRSRVGSRIKDNFAITKLMGVAYISETLEITPSEAEGFKIEATAKI